MNILPLDQVPTPNTQRAFSTHRPFLHNQQLIRNLGYFLAVFLAVVGVLSALSPYLLPEALYYQIAKPLYGVTYTQEQMPELSRHPFQEVLHRLTGAAYMIIGVLQFTPTFRKKYRKLHRQLGRVFILFSLLVGVGGIAMSIFFPFSGLLEALPVALFGTYFLVSTYLAFQYARQRRIPLHQQWMVRSFSLALAISTVRVFFSITHHLIEVDHRQLFLISIWIAWILHTSITEVGIQLAFAKRKKVSQTA